jgi:Protein of unknown function (DUF3987)
MMTLVGCGAALGRGPYYVADGARHGVNLFTGIVGESSKSRKGTAWGRVQTVLIEAADAGFGDRIEAGLSTGEGLINLVRDPREDDDDDLGVCDKRLLIVHSEFSSPLKMMRRGGNNLSEIIREAWDGGRLRVATKNSPLKATDPHISIIGHITRDELVERMNETDAANGFGNRFLWVRARRSKSLPSAAISIRPPSRTWPTDYDRRSYMERARSNTVLMLKRESYGPLSTTTSVMRNRACSEQS